MASATATGPGVPGRAGGFLLIAVIAFLTLVDLFAMQVTIPGLPLRYGVPPATMGAAVSACTFGMAVASLGVALFSNRITGAAATQAFGASVTGNVASILIGRVMASGVAGEWGIDASFHLCAALNLVGAALVTGTIHRSSKMKTGRDHGRSPLAAVLTHLGNSRLRAAFGFCILFVFIGGGPM